MDYIFPPPSVPSLAIVGRRERFPVRRVYCVGRNYVEHAVEMGATGREPPFFFMKPADAVVPAEAGRRVAVAYPPATNDLHHEVEMVVAIGRGGANIAPVDAVRHIFGYAVGLDLTRRDRQAEAKKQGRPWEIGKAFDQSAPIGALTQIEATGEILAGDIVLAVNGTVRQASDVGKLIWPVADVISKLSEAWQLVAGDLIMTGTPAGVGAVARGDVLSARCVGCEPIEVEFV